MPHFKKAFPSKYLQVADLDQPFIATIKRVDAENVGVGEDQELKLVAKFQEDLKALVLNLTRAEAIARIAGDEDTDKWPGTRIRISRGTTTFKGKKVGCIEVDAPPKSKPKAAPVVPDDIDDAMPDIAF